MGVEFRRGEVGFVIGVRGGIRPCSQSRAKAGVRGLLGKVKMYNNNNNNSQLLGLDVCQTLF